MPTVTRYPTTDTAVDGTWTTPTNVQADDANTASCAVGAKNANRNRRQGGYGFDSVIPAGSTIDNVFIEVQHYVVSPGINFLENSYTISGTPGTFNSNSAEPASPGTEDVYDITAARAWTRNDLLDATFGTQIRARNGNNTGGTCHWDYIRVRVVYTEPGNSADVSWAELELPNAPRTAEVSWAELETSNPPRASEVSWAELELPDSGVRAEVSWGEIELPNAPRWSEVSWAELQLGDAPRGADVSWAEFQLPNGARGAEVSWSEVELPNAPPAYTSYGLPFLFTSANWGAVSVYLEAYIRATSGTVYARLYNDTDSEAAAGSEVSTVSGTFVRLRSGALTLADGKTYRVQFGRTAAAAGEFLGGKLVIV